MNSQQELIAKTLEAIKEAAALDKAITTSTGLMGYDLEQPAKNLYPILSPIRNILPRSRAAKGSNAVNWKAITGISSQGSLFVAEGLRNTNEVQYTEVDRSAAYKSYGRDDSVTREAEQKAMGFDDLRARSTRSLLQRLMVEEEDVLVGGNTSLTVAAPGTIVTATAATGGTIPDATYKIYCVALPFLGYRQATILAVNAAPHSNKSAVATQITAGGNLSTLSLSVPVVSGAMAYAWYVGTVGAEKCEAITTINSVKLTALLGTGELATAVVAGTSTDALAFDGMIPQIISGGGLVQSLPSGVAGAGTPLTYDGAGGIVEIDAMLKAQWDATRTGPDIVYMSSQEALNINKKIFQAGGQPIFQFITPIGGGDQGAITAGVRVANYINKFTNTNVRFETHPTLTPGSILFVTFNLPAWYTNTNVDGCWDVHLLEDYYEIVYGPTSRKWEHGVYASGVLRGFMPGAQGILNNIANG